MPTSPNFAPPQFVDLEAPKFVPKQPILSPQELAAIPREPCPQCGRPAQCAQVTHSTRAYVCGGGAHSQPYHFNVHLKMKEGIPSAPSLANARSK